MSGIDTSAPAFPDWPESAFPSTFQSIGPEPHQVHRWGMTLRDYFAAKALLVEGSSNKSPAYDDATRARYAYELADAMLAARSST